VQINRRHILVNNFFYIDVHMGNDKKKKVAIGVIAACLILAGVITCATGSKNSAKLKRGQIVWIKCADNNCGVEYQIDLLDYVKSVSEYRDAASFQTPPIPCEHCGKQTAYKAVECEKCGAVFFEGLGRSDFSDRCTECGYSKKEDQRKK